MIWTVKRTVYLPNFSADYFPQVAIDPGQTTGLAEAVLLREPNPNIYEVKITTHLYEWPGAAAKIKQHLSGAGQVAMENFRLQPLKAASLSWNELPAPRVIGWVEGTLQVQIMMHNLFTYEPSETKMLSNDFLKTRLGDLPPSKPDHQRDALRVLMTHWLKRGG